MNVLFTAVCAYQQCVMYRLNNVGCPFTGSSIADCVHRCHLRASNNVSWAYWFSVPKRLVVFIKKWWLAK